MKRTRDSDPWDGGHGPIVPEGLRGVVAEPVWPPPGSQISMLGLEAAYHQLPHPERGSGRCPEPLKVVASSIDVREHLAEVSRDIDLDDRVRELPALDPDPRGSLGHVA